MAATITGVRVLEGKKPVIVSATVTVPANSEVWGLSIATTVNLPGTPNPTPVSGLSWSQVYDIIDLVGGVKAIVRAGYAARQQASDRSTNVESFTDIRA
jgi:hypothetical protein